MTLGMPHKTRGNKTNYPSAVPEEAWAFCAPGLTWMKEDAPPRDYPRRALFNAVRDRVRAGCPWRMISHDLPPWPTLQPPASRWSKAGGLKPGRTICAKCSGSLRKSRRNLRPSFSNRRTGPSTPESGNRAGADGDQRKKGSKVPAAVETLGHVLALKSDAGQRAGARPGRRVDGRGPGGHGCESRRGLRRSRLHRRRPRRRGRQARSPPGGGQAPGSQKGLYPSAQALGRGTLLCWGRPIPAPCQRLMKDFPPPGRDFTGSLFLPSC
jgi:transposase